CIGILLYIGYLIIGLDFAITLAIIAALTSVVPYIGPIIAISPGIVIALVYSPFMLLKLAIVWAIVQLSEGIFISLNVMGSTMQLHSLTIKLVIFIYGILLSIFGILLFILEYVILIILRSV